MSILGTVTQQPADVQDYDIEFSEWFPPGDQITSCVISVKPPMPAPPSHAIRGQRVKVWVYSGGHAGTKYQISICPTTAEGRKKEVELMVRIKEV